MLEAESSHDLVVAFSSNLSTPRLIPMTWTIQLIPKGTSISPMVSLHDGDWKTIGRGVDCDFPISDDPLVSTTHFRVRLDQDGCVIEDLESSNGLYLNGRKVARETAFDGDIIRAGNCQWQVRVWQSQITSPAPSVSYYHPVTENASGAENAHGFEMESGFEIESGFEKVYGALPSSSIPADAKLGSGVSSSEPLTCRITSTTGESRVIENSLTVGRTDRADWIFPSDPQMSSSHFEIVRHQGSWLVKDLMSSNGLFVESQRTQQATLRDGSRIRAGQTEFTISFISTPIVARRLSEPRRNEQLYSAASSSASANQFSDSTGALGSAETNVEYAELQQIGTKNSFRLYPHQPKVIGRLAESAIPLPNDPQVSSRHAEVVFNGTSIEVRDLQSSNGTFQNEKAVQRAFLGESDRLRVGRTFLLTRLPIRQHPQEVDAVSSPASPRALSTGNLATGNLATGNLATGNSAPGNSNSGPGNSETSAESTERQASEADRPNRDEDAFTVDPSFRRASNDSSEDCDLLKGRDVPQVRDLPEAHDTPHVVTTPHDITEESGGIAGEQVSGDEPLPFFTLDDFDALQPKTGTTGDENEAFPSKTTSIGDGVTEEWSLADFEGLEEPQESNDPAQQNRPAQESPPRDVEASFEESGASQLDPASSTPESVASPNGSPIVPPAPVNPPVTEQPQNITRKDPQNTLTRPTSHSSSVARRPIGFEAFPCGSGLVLYRGTSPVFDPVDVASRLLTATQGFVLDGKAIEDWIADVQAADSVEVAAQSESANGHHFAETDADRPANHSSMPPAEWMKEVDKEHAQWPALLRARWGSDETWMVFSRVPLAEVQRSFLNARQSDDQARDHLAELSPTRLTEFLANRSSEIVFRLMAKIDAIFIEVHQGERWAFFGRRDLERNLQHVGLVKRHRW